jgi:hypothetical protein
VPQSNHLILAQVHYIIFDESSTIPINVTGFLLEKKIGVGQPKRLENCKILVANTPMDTDKIKVRQV